MDPFGAKTLSWSFNDQSEELHFPTPEKTLQTRAPASASGQEVKIEFSPPRKLWHRAFDLTVSIRDPQTIGPNSRIRFYYGADDVTERVMSYARIRYSKNQKEVHFTIPAFRLLPHHNETLMVAYARLDPLGDDYLIGKVFEEPYCPFTAAQDLNLESKLKGFSPSADLIAQIKNLAMLHHLNPALIAGLIAQESSFDAQAVSRAKAIGLTQITAPAQQHVLENLGERANYWPRYPGIAHMTPSMIRVLVASGEINPSNEWRLDHERSILGGISYLKYIEAYWQSFKPLIQRQLTPYSVQHQENILVELILASYNSGPYRVRRNLDRYGQKWLGAPDLGEARKYVHNIKSYCYDFARGY